MSLKSAVLLGKQTPRVALVPEAAWSEADDAAFLASSYGLTPDPWQFTVLEGWMGRRADGRWAAGRCGLAVPRQNGKNGIIEIRELYGMVALGEKFLHTAHEVKTARKAFLRLCSFFENPKFPELQSLVKEIRRTNGQEMILLTNGGSCEFVARSRGSARGFTVDVMVLDEAQELSDEALEALLPTISAAPLGDPQTILTGTPPGYGSNGEVFTRTRSDGTLGKNKRLCWHEWSVTGLPKIGDRDLWAETNPALGGRLKLSSIEDEFDQLSPDGFARERLGLWLSDVSTSRVLIKKPEWARLENLDPPTDGRVAYGVKFAIDGSTVAVGAARKPADGPVHVEVVHHRSMSSGTGWLVDWLVERKDVAAAIVVDGKDGAGALINELRSNGVSAKAIVAPSAGDVITAHSMFYEAVRSGGLSHFAQPGLDEAVAAAEKRAIGKQGGWGWAGIAGTDVSPVECVTLALFGVETSKRRPGRKSKVVVM